MSELPQQIKKGTRSKPHPLIWELFQICISHYLRRVVARQPEIISKTTE